MTSPCNRSLGEHWYRTVFFANTVTFYSNRVPRPGDHYGLPFRVLILPLLNLLPAAVVIASARKYRPVFSGTVHDLLDPDGSGEDGASDKDSSEAESGGVFPTVFRFLTFSFSLRAIPFPLCNSFIGISLLCTWMSRLWLDHH
ncbi:hypothetical protein OIU74_022051 [Salix koriyanagi]|uniref:Uncharacterized protein n=1 Tax=Salix koriyanagi TaxID=2511006 RepID=A0A9Q0WK04_9ROSI|nr:hypothetical protein OIU74_022051 [Salix koriyanagi]